MSKVAVILSGCGVYDGSEIYETVMTLVSLEQQGLEYQCLAPNINQMHVINHLTGEVAEGEQRNVLVEAARLARGEIIDLAEADPADYVALILPGGFGAAKNLSDFAVNGAQAQVNAQVLDFTRAIHQAGKPVGLMCIAPALVPLIFGEGAVCTIGSDAGVAGAIAEMGGQHQACPVDGVVVDRERRIVTTPAYMLAGSISEAASGIAKLVEQVKTLI